MPKLPNYTNSPPGGWRYVVPETGKLIGPFTGHVQLIENIKSHLHAAGYEAPSDLFAKIETFICEKEPETCGEFPATNIFSQTISDMKHTFHHAMQCLATMVSHRAGSGERPSLELQEKRAQVCVACPKNVDLEPCSVCRISTLKSLIEKLAGAKKTSVDAQLKFCSVCHCANSAKVATKLDAIWSHMPERQKKAIDPNCWITREVQEKEAQYAQK